MKPIKINKIEITTEEIEMCDLEVEDNENFILANGILTHNCKTNLAFNLLREYKGNRQIYLLGYPKQIDNFISLNSFNDLFKLQDAIIFIDEIQRFIRTYEHHKNVALQELISFFAHNNNTLIFTTQLSQFITKGTEAFVDTWLITRLNDVTTLKNGSKPKRILQSTIAPQITSWSLALLKGQYLEYSELNEIGENGIKNFSDQGIEKDWRINSQKNIQNTSEEKEIPKRNSSEEIVEKFKDICNRWVEKKINEGFLKLEKCENCGRIEGETYKEKGKLMETELIAHHKQYTYPFTLDDIKILCKSCHNKKGVHTEISIQKIDLKEMKEIKK